MVEFKNGHMSLDVEAINLQVHPDKTIHTTNSYIPIIIPGLAGDISGGTIRFHFRNVLLYFHKTKIFHNIYRFQTT